MKACSSNGFQDTIPPFQKERVCSDEALAYLRKIKSLPVSNNEKYSDNKIHSRMMSIEPSIRSCYEEEMLRIDIFLSFNLCFVVGYSTKGQMDFFKFSTKEIALTAEFKACLAKIKVRDELKGFKNLSIIQPFRLYPKP